VRLRDAADATAKRVPGNDPVRWSDLAATFDRELREADAAAESVSREDVEVTRDQFIGIKNGLLGLRDRYLTNAGVSDEYALGWREALWTAVTGVEALAELAPSASPDGYVSVGELRTLVEKYPVPDMNQDAYRAGLRGERALWHKEIRRLIAKAGKPDA
jgi:hypothetical protein